MIDHFWPLLQILGPNIFPAICVYDLSTRTATTVDVSGLNLTNLLSSIPANVILYVLF